jgi:tetratricopeptide (TPR) repeat protein
MADPVRDYVTSSELQPQRESRIEELLLAGLDHYFSGQHDLAISVWTRVLFLDRSHARARAYIERARGAIAERQREGEELLQTGAAAFSRGDTEDARRLLRSALDRGARPEEALAMLERLDRLSPAVLDLDPLPFAHPPLRYARQAERFARPAGIRAATLLLVLAIGLALGVLFMLARSSGVWPWSSPVAAPASAASNSLPEEPLPLPSASEVSLSRARAWAASGRLYDALAALDSVGPGDPRRGEADEVRGRIQQQLLEAARATQASPSTK